MTKAALIFETLERMAAVCEDPADLMDPVYGRLFALHPEFERLFVLDKSGQVRGEMLQMCIECLIGVAEGSDTARATVAAARFHHDGYGVPDDRFPLMFTVLRDVIRDVLGDDWTPAMEHAWSGLLDELAAIR